MVTVILFAVVGWVITIYRNSEMIDFRDDFIAACGEFLWISFWGIVVGGIIGFLISWAIPCSSVEDRTEYKIVSLQDSNLFNGHCFLGSGTIDQEMVYTFYYETETGFKIKQVSAEYAEIRYSEKPPKATRIRLKDSPGAWWNYFGIDFYQSSWIIEIPEGSIQNNYILDAQQ